MQILLNVTQTRVVANVNYSPLEYLNKQHVSIFKEKETSSHVFDFSKDLQNDKDRLFGQDFRAGRDEGE